MSKPSKLPVACRCGAFSAETTLAAPAKTTRIVCYCLDCQSYAHHLDQADSTLDHQGGTDIIHISPAWFRITKGKKHLSNLRLSPEGLYRWYASCCNTPICNTTTNPAMPFVGLFVSAINKNIDKSIGPVQFGVNAGSKHPIRQNWPVYKGFGFRGIFTTLRNIGSWRMAGDHNRSELIDAATSEPMVEARTLSHEQRLAAKDQIN